MKLFNAIAAAAVIGASFVVPNPVEAVPNPVSYDSPKDGWVDAKDGWIKAGCSVHSNGPGCLYYRVLSKSSRFVIVDVRDTFPKKNGLKHATRHNQIDCLKRRRRRRSAWIDESGDVQGNQWQEWKDIHPETIAYDGAKQVC